MTYGLCWVTLQVNHRAASKAIVQDTKLVPTVGCCCHGCPQWAVREAGLGLSELLGGLSLVEAWDFERSLGFTGQKWQASQISSGHHRRYKDKNEG